MSDDDNMGYGSRCIHVPASGAVADAPSPEAAEAPPADPGDDESTTFKSLAGDKDEKDAAGDKKADKKADKSKPLV